MSLWWIITTQLITLWHTIYAGSTETEADCPYNKNLVYIEITHYQSHCVWFPNHMPMTGFCFCFFNSSEKCVQPHWILRKLLIYVSLNIPLSEALVLLWCLPLCHKYCFNLIIANFKGRVYNVVRSKVLRPFDRS